MSEHSQILPAEASPGALASFLLSFPRDRLELLTEALITAQNLMDGDPDLEPNGDELDGSRAEDDFCDHSAGVIEAAGCPVSDSPGDVSWTEWHTRGRRKDDPGVFMKDGRQCLEDYEDDDSDGGADEGEPNFASVRGHTAGCDIADSDCCPAGDDRIGSGSLTGAMLLYEEAGPGDADDAEREQMQYDVPTLPVFTADHNVFTDERSFLGFSNLQTSFRTNGGEVKSADTGGVLVSTGWASNRVPGVPV